MSLAIADLVEILRCPSSDRGDLILTDNKLICQKCGKTYVIENEIVVMLQEAK